MNTIERLEQLERNNRRGWIGVYAAVMAAFLLGLAVRDLSLVANAQNEVYRLDRIVTKSIVIEDENGVERILINADRRAQIQLNDIFGYGRMLISQEDGHSNFSTHYRGLTASRLTAGENFSTFSLSAP
jgi:hypothetical protein